MHSFAKILVLIFTVILTSWTADAQYRRNQFNILEGMTITPLGGYNMFYGDLVDESRGSVSLGVMADRELSEFLSARASFISGQMQGTQILPDINKSYAYFENIYSEFTVGGTYRPLNHIFGYFKQRTFQPYAHLNAGLVYYRATEYWGEESGQPVGEEWRSANELVPVVSTGGGIKLWISPLISAQFELSGALPFSDRMDVHDVWYRNYNDWVARENPQSTDPYDVYFTYSFGITFTILDSKFSNDPKYNRKSYIKTRNYYQSSSKRNRSQRPDKKGFLFFW